MTLLKRIFVRALLHVWGAWCELEGVPSQMRAFAHAAMSLSKTAPEDTSTVAPQLILLPPRVTLQFKRKTAAVTYKELHETQHLTIGVFVFDAGAKIPLHDHPGMAVSLVQGVLLIVTGPIPPSREWNSSAPAILVPPVGHALRVVALMRLARVDYAQVYSRLLFGELRVRSYDW